MRTPNTNQNRLEFGEAAVYVISVGFMAMEITLEVGLCVAAVCKSKQHESFGES